MSAPTLPAGFTLHRDITPLPKQWTFWCNRIIGNQPIGPVAPLAFAANKTLNGFGAGTVVLPARNSPLTTDDLLRLWSWRLWAYYDGKPVWCGAPTGIVDHGTATVELTLTELAGYLTMRQLEVAKNYRGTEQLTIARELAAPVSAVGVNVVVSPSAAFKRDRQYEFLDGENRADLLTNLAGVISGPEFRTEYDTNPATGLPAATLRLAYPRVGTDTGLGLTVPGNLVDNFAATWDSENLRTRTYAVGTLPENAPDNAKQPVVVVDRPQPDLPQLDRVDDHEGTILVATLKDKANTAASIYATPTLNVTGSVFETNPPLTDYGVGDNVTVIIRDDLLPGGYSTSARLGGISFDAATGKCEWTLALTSPPAKPRDTLAGRLRGLSTSVHKIFRGPNLEVQP